MSQTRKQTEEAELKLQNILDESMEILVSEYAEGVSLWKELDQEDGDKSWYQKFGGKVVDIKNDIIEKVKQVKVHLTKIEDETKPEGEINVKEGKMGPLPKDIKTLPTETKQNMYLNTLSLVLRKIQELVRDHGSALEFLRAAFMKHDELIEDLKVKVDQRPEEDWYENEIHNAVDAKQKVNDDKIKELEDTVNRVLRENADIKHEKEELKKEVTETRQRGLKGNLIISCPVTQGRPTKATRQQKADGTGVESPQEMCSRLIKEVSGVSIPPKDMMACHQLGGEKNKNNWIIRVDNRSPDSGWESLAAGMVSGKRPDQTWFNTNLGIYLNFMLAPVKSDLLRQVRVLRKRQLIHKYSVNQNGRITFLKERSPRAQQGNGQAREPWIEVKDFQTLKSNFPNIATVLGGDEGNN